MSEKQILITIDGPSGVGKSTLAKKLAVRLGYLYLDTGALYRTLGLKARLIGIALDSIAEERIQPILDTTKISIKLEDHQQKTFMDGMDVSQLIREPIIDRYASKVSALANVRQFLLDYQRDMGKDGGLVAEGRDMGTVVFPEAEIKFFITADPEVRANRRHRELVSQSQSVKFEEVLAGINKRDQADSSREIAPLKLAQDAILLDTTSVDEDQAVDLAMQFIADR